MEENNALVQWESNDALQLRVKKMLQVQQTVMMPEIDYGIIPGCKKPSLFKPGAELLMVTFCLSDRLTVEDLSEPGVYVRYRVTSEIHSQQTGAYLGCGVGEASTTEEKYHWRKAVCDEEWEETDLDNRRTKWFKPYKKSAYSVRQVKTNPSDVANTVLKMAKKRSKVDAVMSVLGASRIYTQDIDDMGKEYDGMISEDDQPRSKKPDIKKATTEKGAVSVSNNGAERIKPTDGERQSGKLISEKQGYFLIGQMKENKVKEAAVLNLLGIKSIFFVTWAKSDKYCMEKLLKTIQDMPEFFKAHEPKAEPVKAEVEPPTVFDNAEYLEMLRATAGVAGCKDDESINKRLVVNFPKVESIDKIDADSQQIILDYFVALKDNPEQA